MMMNFGIFVDPLEARCEMSAGRLQLNIAEKESRGILLVNLLYQNIPLII